VPLPAHLEPLCTAFIRGLDAVLGAKLCAVYLYGAIAFPEGDASGDVDFHVIVREPLTDIEKTGLKDLHAALARGFPPSGADMDGYYLLLDDARRTTPPAHQFLPGVSDQSWALSCAHMRAGRYIRLRGPDPAEIYPAVSWPELEAALWHEHDFIVKHLAEYPDYCILNLCRLIYSFQTRDVVVSKRFSGVGQDCLSPMEPSHRRRPSLLRSGSPCRGSDPACCPDRALLRVCRGANSRRHLQGCCSQQQHRVPERIESIPLPDRFFVGMQDQLPAGKGRD
jgi:hypothetical protein